LTLAVEEINAGGGVSVKGEKRPFKLEIMDTRDCEPGVPVSEALLVVEKVILDKKADFVIAPSRSEAALASLATSLNTKRFSATCGGMSPKFSSTIVDDMRNSNMPLESQATLRNWLMRLLKFSMDLMRSTYQQSVYHDKT
jgi:branched-chain amino acid transport system substrate-binding protein